MAGVIVNAMESLLTDPNWPIPAYRDNKQTQPGVCADWSPNQQDQETRRQL